MRPTPPSASYRPTPMPSHSPAAPPPEATPTTSPWHSPVPYLFGGLAAMLGLIALALLILACSYWKLNTLLGSGDADADASTGDGDGSKSPAVAAAASPAAFADLVAVVMAGDKTPTFLAAPIVRRVGEGDSTAAARAGEGSTETEEGKNGGEPGEGESGVLAADNAERGDRQADHV